MFFFFLQNEPVDKYVQEAISRGRTLLAMRPSSGSIQRIQQDVRACKEAERKDRRYRVISSLRPKSEDENVIATVLSHTANSNSNDLPGHSTKGAVTPKDEDTKNPIIGNFQMFDMLQEELEKSETDVEDTEPETILCNSVKMIRERLTLSEVGHRSEHQESMDDYVYDIYYSDAPQLGWIQDILSVQPYMQEQELVADEPEPDEIYEDEDDENEESNWRNDYPDEEDSENEERYSGYYEQSDEETRGQAWQIYRQKAMREFKNAGDTDSD
ncbi:hypothetical protein GDO86_008445 [Hymenochirus boettgeri]|uniref:Probable RNA polymerase II nuclear localization protein SLC7A6OS n=1 Tax=Hymenochirus boettgeri TaxID=247094 RepID=A0A8T2J221_9PIPI|nr:hypothetical protein GDO86_008445 [Hymenochirus boettgeri]